MWPCISVKKGISVCSCDVLLFDCLCMCLRKYLIIYLSINIFMFISLDNLSYISFGESDLLCFTYVFICMPMLFLCEEPNKTLICKVIG